MITAVEFDNDSNDDNANTNPAKVKTSPSKKTPLIIHQLKFHTFQNLRDLKKRTLILLHPTLI